MERVSSSETSDPTPKNDESENSAEIISEIEQEIDEARVKLFLLESFSNFRNPCSVLNMINIWLEKVCES